jgi:predicted nucleotidyltransferase
MKRKEVEDNLIVLGIVGSRAYGTNLESSDTDLKGIMIAPMQYHLGLYSFEQKDQWDEKEVGNIGALDLSKDKVVYEVKKFMQMVAKQNPNILDLLYLPDEFILHKTPEYEYIANMRDFLLSKEAYKSYNGYAYAQIKRMDTHRAWLTQEAQGIVNVKPDPADYLTEELRGLNLLPTSELYAFYEFLVTLLRDRIQYFDEYDEIQLAFKKVDWTGLIKQHGLSDEVDEYVQRTTNCSDNYIRLLHATQEYNAALRKYQNWKDWTKNRNPERSALERKCGYDCHVDSTQYLTLQGFKEYDQITESDLLGTYNTVTGELEFQPYINRFSYTVEDIDIYELDTYKTSFGVTENHRLWIQPVTRKPSSNYKPAPSGEWQFVTAKELPNEFNYATRFENNNTEYAISDEKLKLIGIYVAEGCINYGVSRKGVAYPKSVRIEQEVTGKANALFTEDFCAHWNIKTYKCKKRNNTYEGFIYVIGNKALAQELESLCGRYSIDKHLPDFVYSLSKRQIEILLHSMYLGDGTKLKNNAVVYYTISPLLADQMQILSTLCDKYAYVAAYDLASGYNPHRIYHVYISHQHNAGYKHTQKSQSSSVVKYSGRVHCFETSNSTLVTRLKGKIAMHGNSKNAMHCIRLQRMVVEILTDEVVHVHRPDAEYLKTIRRGEVSYEELMAESERLKEAASAALKVSLLPDKVDKAFVSSILEEILAKKFQCKPKAW